MATSRVTGQTLGNERRRSDARKRLVRAPMTCIPESEFIARVEELMAELGSRRDADGSLRRRWEELLMEGYGRALAVEGKRRRVLRRQRELAGLPRTEGAVTDELVSLVRCEAALAHEERRLRDLLARLRGRGLPILRRRASDPAGGPIVRALPAGGGAYGTRPRRSACTDA